MIFDLALIIGSALLLVVALRILEFSWAYSLIVALFLVAAGAIGIAAEER